MRQLRVPCSPWHRRRAASCWQVLVVGWAAVGRDEEGLAVRHAAGETQARRHGDSDSTPVEAPLAAAGRDELDGLRVGAKHACFKAGRRPPGRAGHIARPVPLPFDQLVKKS